MGKLHQSGNKTISKRQNKTFNKQKKGKKEFKPIGKRGRLIVRNLPFKCSEQELLKHFQEFGKVKDVQLLRRPDNKLVGCGFVEFGSRLDADKAIGKLNGQPFMGRQIYVERAVAQERYNTPKIKENDEAKGNISALVESEVKAGPDPDGEENVLDTSDIKQEELGSDDEKEKLKHGITNSRYSKKQEKSSMNIKKARLIVRNLSFETTEDKLRSHFIQFGDVSEVTLLRRPDNTLVGCGFVQFTKKLAAAKAIHRTSGKPFLGRPIIVDWAVAKDTYKKIQEESAKKEIKKEEDDSDNETKFGDASKVKAEETSDSESDESNEKNSDTSDSDEGGGESDSADFEDDEDGTKPKIKQEVDEPRKQRFDDIEEGKTVFIKNLPFSADNEELRECMEQFGPVFYALVCRDKLTEHSKGSGFVKFKKKEDAEKCLNAGTELTLKGNTLDPHPALKRNDVQKLNDKTKEKKDNRNLYLVKEGLIIAGTPAARGVSVADMERRLQLEQWKTTKLRNLNMFVSHNRLVTHNLPAAFSDKQLSKLFQAHAGPRALITEAKVMRNLRKIDNKGHGISKGYGFISFEKHEDALKALRSINNNPNIFTPTSRPIVAFSIENRTVVNTKTKRMIKSRQKNPLCKDYKPDELDVPAKKAKREGEYKSENDNEPEYAGMVAKPGSAVKMRQRYKLKNQAEQHSQNVRKQKREMKVTRQIRRANHIKKKQSEKTIKKKKNIINNDDVAFTKLVDKYKTKIMSQTVDKKKWYD